MAKPVFENKIVFIGFGAIGRATLVPLVDLVDFKFDNLVIVDAVDRRNELQGLLAKGATFVLQNVTQQNYERVLQNLVKKGDILIDAAINTDTCDLMRWCAEHEVMFFNTAGNEWGNCKSDLSDLNGFSSLFSETLDEENAINTINSKFNGKSATAVISHGANPGLVNHITKIGIEEIATTLVRERPDDPRVTEILQLLQKKNKESYGRLAQLLGIKVIQISENDSQRVEYSKEKGSFLSAWSVESYCEELSAPAEFAWGTHEKTNIQGSSFFQEKLLGKSLVTLKNRGHQVYMKSWIPGTGDNAVSEGGNFSGMLVRHEECVTMSKYLEVKKDGVAVYRPTMYFVYSQNVSTSSIREFVSEENNYQLLPHPHIVTKDVVDGADCLGVFLLGHDFGGWWIGSQLDVHTARSSCMHMSDLVGYVGPTSLQVGCSLAAAICWGIMNPTSGANFPEDLPSDFIIGIAKSWLGKWVSVRHDWKPTAGTSTLKSPSSTDCSSFSSDSSDSDSEGENTSSSDDGNLSRRSSPTPASPASLVSNDDWQFQNFIDYSV